MTLFSEAFEVLEQAVEQRVFPGATFGVLHPDGVELGAVGHLTYHEDAPAMSAATIFDVASLTKVMATTVLAMRLWQDGILRLEMPLVELLPEFANDDPLREKVTLGMLLAHSSGLPAHRRLYQLPEVVATPTPQEAAAAALSACLAEPLERSPGASAEYSDIGFLLLGEALRILAGAKNLASLVRRDIFSPLSLNGTGFLPGAGLRPQIAPTCDWRWRHRVLQGEVHDENCALLGGVAGHAGLFSTVGDVLRFASAMLKPGSFFHAATIDLFARRVSGSRALGWDTPSEPSQSGHFFSARSIGHLGYTGTSLWIDLDRKIAITLLTNRVYTGPTASPLQDRYAIQRVRPAFHDAIMRQLVPQLEANSR